MSSYWAGYSGIAFVLSGEEFEKFFNEYQYRKYGNVVPSNAEEYEDRESDFCFDNNIAKLSNEYIEGYTFFPYKIKGKANFNYENTASDLSQDFVYLFLASYDNNGIQAMFENCRYSSYEELLKEFVEKYEKYLPQDFEWDEHLGIYSYAAWA